MELELPIRWVKPKTKERERQEKEYKRMQDLGIEYNELEPENYNEVFSYDPMTFKIEDLARFCKVDNEHITLTFHDGLKYVAKIPYLTFQAVYESLTMRRIMIINNNRLQTIERVAVGE